MTCLNCSREILYTQANFCPYCGEALVGQTEVLVDDDLDEMLEEAEDEAEIKRLNKQLIIIESILGAVAAVLIAAIILAASH